MKKKASFFKSEKDFQKFSDEEFQRKFLHIITQSDKDTTYKYAFARFLLEYAEFETNTRVSFDNIAKYFLKYYWPQICTSKLFQSVNHRISTSGDRIPKIVKIIRTQLPEPYYPHTFEQISKKYPEKITQVIQDIKKEALKIVTYAFQRISLEENMTPMFFNYKIFGYKPNNPSQEYVDLKSDIEINPHAIDFLKRYGALLKKVTIFEWAKFLEPLNYGYPQIIRSIESEFEPRNLTKERKLLEKIQNTCFYCEKSLLGNSDTEKINVEHVIPYSYLKHNKLWNLTLACNKCNCKKLGRLPNPKEKWIKKIHDRNMKYRNQIKDLDTHLIELGDQFKEKIDITYELAKNQGFVEIQMP